MACANISNQDFVDFENFLATSIQQFVLASSVYTRSVPRVAWPDGMGDTFSYNIFNRVLPTGDLNFQATTQASNPPGNPNGQCNISTNYIEGYNTTQRNVTLLAKEILGPLTCLMLLQNMWQFRAQLANTVEQMRFISAYIWEREIQRQWIEKAEKKVILSNPNALTFSTTWSNVAAVSKLTWEVLENLFSELYDYGAEGIGKTAEGTDVYEVITHWSTNQDLKLANDNILNNIRFGSNADSLMGNLGIAPSLSYRNMKFSTVRWPQRYNFVGGQYIEVPPYIQVANGNGTQALPNPEYRTAGYQDTVIFVRNAFQVLIPTPANLGSGYDPSVPQNWMGSPKWMQQSVQYPNAASTNCNTRGDQGFYNMDFMFGAQSLLPDQMIVVRHQTCLPNLGFSGCANTGSVS